MTNTTSSSSSTSTSSSMFSNAPANVTIAITNKYIQMLFIGMGDKVRVVTIGTRGLTPLRQAGENIWITLDQVVSPMQARRFYAKVIGASKGMDTEFGFHSKLDRKFVEGWLKGLRVTPLAHQMWASMFGE